MAGSLEQNTQLLTDSKRREQELQASALDAQTQLQVLVTQKTEVRTLAYLTVTHCIVV